jgi:hypothetical protein
MSETLSRRDLLGHMATGIGAAALASLLNQDGLAADDSLPHFVPKA